MLRNTPRVPEPRCGQGKEYEHRHVPSLRRDAGSDTRFLKITSPALKRWAVIYRPCRDGCFYPNSRCLSIVTQLSQQRYELLLERPLLMMLGLLRNVVGDD